ncbi:putative galacturonosyltransferase 10 [Bienertia sinuspersici]
MQTMRRRNPSFGRHNRRRYSNFIWLALCGIVILLFFIVLLSKDNQPMSRPALTKKSYRQDRFLEGLNVTEEMLSATSLTRQLSDQIALAKSLVVIAKESNNLQFAWELSAQIRNSQILLSNAATRRSPLTIRESETAIKDMALLLYQAQQLHYDSATMIMRLRPRSTAEEVPKSLYCLGVRLTTEWFINLSVQRWLSERKSSAWKLEDNSLYHFCIFSDNILATSVVINSTALNSKAQKRLYSTL